MPAVKAITKKTAQTATKRPAKKTAQKVTLEDLSAIIADIGKAHTETEKTLKELQLAHKETEKILGRLGIRLGDISEATLLPDLPEKFKRFGFTFQVINRSGTISRPPSSIPARSSHCGNFPFIHDGPMASIFVLPVFVIFFKVKTNTC
jgi:hypothetical protein